MRLLRAIPVYERLLLAAGSVCMAAGFGLAVFTGRPAWTLLGWLGVLLIWNPLYVISRIRRQLRAEQGNRALSDE